MPKGSFSNGSNFGLSYLDAAALAELGFIVVQIDGRGATLREKSFFDECYGWLESCSNLDDHVAGIKQLAERYPYMDLERVGITNTHGGPGGVQGLLQYPGFYTVGVSFCLHDSRLVGATMWGEKFEGKRGSKEALSDEQPKRHSYPENHVHKLQGKLLLMHGMLDAAIPPAATFRLMAALQNANKDFDSLIMPTVGHVTTSYFVRRTWDYFVTHLLDVNPPKEFDLKTMYG